MTQEALRVINLMEHGIADHLNDRAKQVLANPRYGTSPDMRTYAMRVPGAIEPEHIRDFALRISALATLLDGREQTGPLAAYVHGSLLIDETIYRPKLDASLAPPMGIPLASGGHMLLAYLFVYDVPTGLLGKQWLDHVTRDIMPSSEEGAVNGVPYFDMLPVFCP